MKRIVKWVFTGLAAIVGLWLLVAAALVLVPAPKFVQPPFLYPGPTPSPVASDACLTAPGIRCFQARDGALLAARQTGTDGGTIVLLLHGVLGSGAQLEPTAQGLHATTGSTVIRLDLRGHGLSAGKPGDVTHVGQYDEDVADVVVAVRREVPGARVVLAGHSMGGGIATRYAARRPAPGVDGYLLFAPLLGTQSPTNRNAPAPSAGPTPELPMKLHVPRLVGLAMFNVLGIRVFNDLGTLRFNLGDGFPLRSYSYRAVSSMAHEDYRGAMTADRKPLLLVVGSDDEAFEAGAYPGVVALHQNGRAVIVPGASHDGVMNSDATVAAVREWMTAGALASAHQATVVLPAHPGGSKP